MIKFKKTISKIYNVGKNIWNTLKNAGKETIGHGREMYPSTVEDADDTLTAEVDTLKLCSSVIFTCKLLSSSNGFSIALCTIDNNIALRVSVLIDKNLVGRNFQINGYWGSEETDTELSFSLKANINYQIEIFTINEAYLIALNGFHIARYKHHLPYRNVNQITIHGSITDVRILQDIIVEYPTRLNKTLHIGHLVSSVRESLQSGKRHDTQLVESQYDTDTEESSNIKFLTFFKKKRKAKDNKKKMSARNSNENEETKTSNDVPTFTEIKEVNVEDVVENEEEVEQEEKEEEEEEEEEEIEEVEDDNDIFDKELFYTTEVNGNYLPLPFYGTFKKGTFKMRYTLLIKGRVHNKPQKLIVNLQNGTQVWPPPTNILTIKILFIRLELIPNSQSGNDLVYETSNVRRKTNIFNSASTSTNYCDDDEYKLILPDDIANGLQPNSVFYIEILRKLKHFEIFINNVSIKIAPYTKNPKLATAVFINGDFKLYDIEIISD